MRRADEASENVEGEWGSRSPISVAWLHWLFVVQYRRNATHNCHDCANCRLRPEPPGHPFVRLLCGCAGPWQPMRRRSRTCEQPSRRSTDDWNIGSSSPITAAFWVAASATVMNVFQIGANRSPVEMRRLLVHRACERTTCRFLGPRSSRPVDAAALLRLRAGSRLVML